MFDIPSILLAARTKPLNNYTDFRTYGTLYNTKQQVLLSTCFPETVNVENLPIEFKTIGIWEETGDPLDLRSDGSSR